MAAGHSVVGMQDTLDVLDIRGHRDCVISGMLFDVKSAASFSFSNFTRKGVRQNDNYGYVSQLSSYLYASRDDPLVTYKDKAGFLFVDKQFGTIESVILDLTKELDDKEEEVNGKKKLVKQSEPPEREYEATHGKIGSKENLALPNSPCGYCDHKIECWGNLEIYRRRSDDYKIYFTEVNKELNEEYWEKLT
jgi:hypothetical protein